MTLRRALAPTVAYVVLGALALFWLVPFAWPILASLNPTASTAVAWPSQASYPPRQPLQMRSCTRQGRASPSYQ